MVFLSNFRRSSACFGACAEAKAVISGFEGEPLGTIGSSPAARAVMRQPNEHSCGHYGVTEDACPFAEAEIGGDDNADLIAELAD